MSVTALLFAAALSGQAVPDAAPICWAEGQEAACEESERARLDRLNRQYRVGRIEEAAEAGATVYRVLILNPWGRDLAMVTAMSSPGQPPRIIAQGRDGGRVMSNISPATWRRIVDDARGIDAVRQPPPPPPPGRSGPDSEVTQIDYICLDGGLVSIEMANTPDVDGRTKPVRRLIQAQCGFDTRAADFGYGLTQIAVENLPLCQRLTGDRFDWAVWRLQACVALKGWRRTAADLMSRTVDVPEGDVLSPRGAGEWADWLATDGQGRLDWNGVVHQEDAATPGVSIPAALAEHLKDVAEVRFYQADFGARSGRDGWVEGEIRTTTSEQPERQMVADYRQTWRRRDDGGWSLRTWTVGPFRSEP